MRTTRAKRKKILTKNIFLRVRVACARASFSCAICKIMRIIIIILICKIMLQCFSICKKEGVRDAHEKPRCLFCRTETSEFRKGKENAEGIFACQHCWNRIPSELHKRYFCAMYGHKPLVKPSLSLTV